MKIDIPDTDELLESRNPEELGDWEDELKALVRLVHKLKTKYKNEPAHYVGQLRRAETEAIEAIINDLDTNP
jgi:hypothetical protein